MLLPSAPTTVKNNFFKELRDIVDEDRFNSLKRYYDSLRKDIENNILMPLEYKSISDRLETTRYFYFPTETSAKHMNCFERSASLYFAFLELYPKSKPALVFLTDKNKNMHASVLFMHDNELFGADPSYEYFDKIRLEPDAIVIPKPEGVERIITFERIREADEIVLEYMAKKLRSDKGIIDFFYESGQRVAYSHLVFLHQSLFMKVKPDNQIVSEIRLFGDGFQEKNACIRFTYNPITGTNNVEFLRYETESWGVLLQEQQEQPLIETPYRQNIDIFQTSHITQLQDIARYLKNGRDRDTTLDEITQFSNHPIVRGRFEKIFDVAKNIDENTYLDFVKYLRFRYGSPDSIKPKWNYNRHQDAANRSLEEISSGLNEMMKEEWEICHLQLVPAFLKFAEDSKKYTREVKQQMQK